MRRFRQNRWLLVPALSLAVTAASAAAAQPASDQAEQLFREAREALGRGDYAAACPKFAESVRLTRRPGPLLNLAQCEEHQGQLLNALKHWREGSKLLPSGDSRSALAAEHVAALDKKIPRLTVQLSPEAPPGTRITLDGAELGPSAIGKAQELEHGDHVIITMAPGHAGARSTVTLSEGERREITMTPGSEQPQAPSPSVAVAPPPVAAPKPRRSDGWTAGFIVGGVGVAGVIAGAVTGVLAIKKNKDYEDLCGDGPTCADSAAKPQSELKVLTTASTVAFAVGGAAVVTGIVLIATSSSKAAPAPTAVAFTVLPSGAGFSMRGSF